MREPKQQDICYATQNRQDAIKVLAPQVDMLIVVGSPTSSNSNRLRELGERKLGADAYMVDQPEDLQAQWFEGKRRVGLTAGASAPDILVQQVIDRHARAGRGVGAQDGRVSSRKPRASRCPRAWATGSMAEALNASHPAPRRAGIAFHHPDSPPELVLPC